MEVRLPNDFKEFLRLLNASSVEYLLIGGYAVAYYGYPRATNDIDIWIAVNSANASRMVDALRQFGFNTPDLNAEIFLVDHGIVRMGVPPMRIEIVTAISGVTFAECFAERIVGDLDGVQVNIISLERLRENKLASGRFKDLGDLENLP